MIEVPTWRVADPLSMIQAAKAFGAVKIVLAGETGDLMLFALRELATRDSTVEIIGDAIGVDGVVITGE